MGEYSVLGVGESLLIALCGFLIVFSMLFLLIVIIKIVSAVVVAAENKAKDEAPTAPAAPKAPAPAASSAPADGKDEAPSKPWDGKLQLIDCDEETAACIMAIISDETDIPLDELQFRRIAAL